VNKDSRRALDLLEWSLSGAPVAAPGAPAGAPARRLKLPPPSVCAKVLAAAARSPDAEIVLRASGLAEALALQDVAVEPAVVAGLAEGLARVGAADRALPLIDSWLARNLEVLGDDDAAEGAPLALLTRALASAASSGDADAALQVLARMARCGLAPPLPALTPLVQLFARAGDFATARAVVAWMLRSGLTPSSHTYTALFAAPAADPPPSARPAALAAAEEAWAEMRAGGCAPTAHALAAYARLCGHLGGLAAARAAWADADAAGAELDLVAFGALADAAARCGDAAGAEEAVAAASARGLTPDVRMRSAQLRALARAPGGAAAARGVWASMAADGLQPNGRCFSGYLEVLLAGDDAAGADALLAEAGRVAAAPGAPAGGEAVDVPRMYESAITAAAAAGDLERARALAAAMRARGVPHTQGTAAALFAAQAAARGAAARWLLSPPGEGRAGHDEPLPGVSGAAVDGGLLGLGGAAAAAAAAAALARPGGVPRGEALALLGGLAVQGRAEAAARLLADLEARGAGPGPWAPRLLLHAALNAPADERLDLVLRALASGRRAGTAWDRRARRAAIEALRAAPDAAELLAVEADDGAAPAPAELEAKLRKLMSSRDDT
jgi:hypothetical protein